MITELPYNGGPILSRRWSVEWCHFQWSTITLTGVMTTQIYRHPVQLPYEDAQIHGETNYIDPKIATLDWCFAKLLYPTQVYRCQNSQMRHFRTSKYTKTRSFWPGASWEAHSPLQTSYTGASLAFKNDTNIKTLCTIWWTVPAISNDLEWPLNYISSFQQQTQSRRLSATAELLDY